MLRAFSRPGLLLIATTIGLTVLYGAVTFVRARAASPTVSLARTPGGGIQPQALIDNNGVIHLIYYTGDPGHGDIYYVHKKAGENAPFSEPIRVNSTPGSAIAVGTIRGAQLALGKDNRVMVVWNGSDRAQNGPGGSPMLFASLNGGGTAFEPERNLITKHGGLDGGGSVAADDTGNVYVVWHAIAPGTPEDGGNIYLARSTDNGKSFAAEKRINPEVTGACGCCSMRAYVDKKGSVYVLYRSASNGGASRDTILLVSNNRGATFSSSMVQRWPVNACPMTSFSLAEAGNQVLGAWETSQGVYYGKMASGASAFGAITAPSGVGVGGRKYPVAVPNSKGQVLVAWAEGCGWAHGGSVAWQVYDKNGQPSGTKGHADGVPTWSLISAVPRPDGTFILFY